MGKDLKEGSDRLTRKRMEDDRGVPVTGQAKSKFWTTHFETERSFRERAILARAGWWRGPLGILW